MASSLSCAVTSLNPSGPRLRRTRRAGPLAVSTMAARSIQPSLSKSSATTLDAPVASCDGERDALEALAVYIAPEGYAGCSGVGESYVHPAIFVEVEDGDGGGWWQRFVGEERRDFECAVARVGEEGGRGVGAGDEEVYGAVVVEVGEDGGGGAAGAAEAGLFRPVGEGLVAVVAPEDVGASAVGGCAGDEEVEVAVVVVVDEDEVGGAIGRGDSGFFGDVGELAVAEIAEEEDAVAHGEGEVGEAVVVEVARGAGYAVSADGEAGLVGGERIEAARGGAAIGADGVGAVAHDDEAEVAAAVHVDEACARVRGCGILVARALPRFREGDGNHGTGFEGASGGIFGAAEAALFAVVVREGRGELGVGDLAEAIEGDLGLFGFALTLEGAGETELGGGVERVEFERGAVLGYGGGEVVQLKLEGAEEVVAVRVRGIEREDALEGFDALLVIVLAAIEEAEDVPGVGIVGGLLGGVFERGFGLGELLQIEEGDAFVGLGEGERWVELVGLSELLRGLFEELLAHQRGADVVRRAAFCLGAASRRRRGYGSEVQSRRARLAAAILSAVHDRLRAISVRMFIALSLLKYAAPWKGLNAAPWTPVRLRLLSCD